MRIWMQEAEAEDPKSCQNRTVDMAGRNLDIEERVLRTSASLGEHLRRLGGNRDSGLD